MQEYNSILFTEERALFGTDGAKINDCTFEKGESPVKECKNIEINGSLFKWKYPLWYCDNVTADNCTWFDTARAGMWYTSGITVRDAMIQAHKSFRRSSGIRLENVILSNAEETLWSCEDVTLENVTARGNYFAMNCIGVKVDGLMLDGNYSFDGVKSAVIENSKLLTKDAFWNSENVTVRNSFIFGEYLGWNSKNLTLENCTIESLQGMCYVDNLKMINCKLVNTALAFEYSSVEARLSTGVDSVFNPKSGYVEAPSIGSLIFERDKVDPSKTKIVCAAIGEKLDAPEWTVIKR